MTDQNQRLDPEVNVLPQSAGQIYSFEKGEL